MEDNFFHIGDTQEDEIPLCEQPTTSVIEDDDWQTIRSCPANKKVKTNIHNTGEEARNEATLIYKNNLFWLSDMSMYVYYTPTHWRQL